jgi:hypothetical protein
MNSKIQSKLIQHVVNYRINLYNDVITLDDIKHDLSKLVDINKFTEEQLLSTMRYCAKNTNYKFMSDRIVRSKKFIGV